MPDPTAAELIALVELEQQATRGEWRIFEGYGWLIHPVDSLDVVAISGSRSEKSVTEEERSNACLIATLRNLEPRRTLRELVRMAAGECNCNLVCYGPGAVDSCDCCTASAWIAEQMAKGCESAAFLGPEVPCGTCVPCLLKELPDA